MQPSAHLLFWTAVLGGFVGVWELALLFSWKMCASVQMEGGVEEGC